MKINAPKVQNAAQERPKFAGLTDDIEPQILSKNPKSGRLQDDLPEGFPKQCPECNKELTRSLNVSVAKGRVGRFVERWGPAIVMSWLFLTSAGFMFGIFPLPESHRDHQGLAVLLVPCLLLIVTAFVAPKVVRLRCNACHWSDSYPLKSIRSLKAKTPRR